MGNVLKNTFKQFQMEKINLSLVRVLLKKYDENSDKRYIFEVVVDYLKELQKAHNNLPFSSERM